MSEKSLPEMFFLLNRIKNVKNHNIFFNNTLVFLGLSDKISIKPNKVFCYGVTEGEKEDYEFYSIYDSHFKNN